ncbi:MAG: hypothetical protein K2N51_03765 [Lachnospiraceae bacterium]|nr:hypothetical protein [Lachnospiraceae bacterium]
MNYYVCVLTTGERLDFDKEVVDIEWNGDMCQVRDKENTIIGIIPMINIQYFKLVKKEG